MARLRRDWPKRGYWWLYRLWRNRRWETLVLVQIALIWLLYWSWPPVTLTLVLPAGEVSYWQETIQRFEADHRRIRIRPVGVASPQEDITVKIRDLCSFDAGRSPCDIVYLDVIWVAEMASEGWLQDLSGKVDAADLAAFVGSEVAAGRYQGGLYRVPFRADFGLLYYRADLLQQAGYRLPQTYDELLTKAQALQGLGQNGPRWGYLWQAQQEGLITTFVEVLQGHGGYWIDPDTQAVGLDQPEAIAAVQFLRRTIELGISPPLDQTYGDTAAVEAFMAGETAFMRHWPWVTNAAGDRLAMNPQAQRVPMTLHAPGETGGGCKGSWGLGIARRSPHPRQAWQAVQYLTSAASQRHFAEQTGYIPS
ncbi:MAG: extracellular solute-binding protein, partial [Cyanobacteria bacterium P01_A01_bin.135]